MAIRAKHACAFSASAWALAISLTIAGPVRAQTQAAPPVPRDADAAPTAQRTPAQSPPQGVEEPVTEPGQSVALSPSPPSDTADDTAQDIIVTGTNISGVKQVGSETVVLKREDVLATGKTNVADVLRTLPQVQNAGSFTAASSGSAGNAQAGGNPTRGNAINLRGVGQGGTLTLVDGHRVTPSGTAAAFTEANQVPLAAIERIEVIPDGASAIYGSDAIAGVINYVLRKDFKGLELGGSYTGGNFNNDEYSLTGTAGTRWHTGFGDGSIIATYEFTHRDPYLRGLNPRLRADQRAYGGQDNRVVANTATPGLAGNIVIPTVGNVRNPAFPQGGAYTYYTLPDNPTGRQLTAADLRVVTASCATPATCTAYPNLIDRSDYEDYLGGQKRHQAAVFASQQVGPLSFYDQFFWTRTEQFTRTYASGNQNANPFVYIDPSNPSYIAGLANSVRSSLPGVFPAVPQPLVVQLNLLARMPVGAPRFGSQNPDESFNNTVGVRAKLFGDWKAEAYYTFGQDKSCGICYLGNYVSLENNANAINLLYDPIGSVPVLGLGLQSALQNLVDRPVGDPLRVDPLSTKPFTQAQLDYILGTNSQYAQNWSHDIIAKVDGSLINLPGGPLKAALGGEYYAGIQKLQNAANRPPDPGAVTTPDANARTVRTQYAAFGELYIPIIGDAMKVPLVQAFTIDAALRYDHYSDFGGTTNPKVSATWVVTDDFKLRGSWGTSFRAPGLPEINAGVFSVGVGLTTTLPPGVTDIPNTNGQAATLLYIGNNPHLKAETGTNWQIGGDITPRFVPGLRLSATYFNIAYKNKLGSAPDSTLFLATAANRALYAPYIVPINNPANCTNADPSTFDPKLREFTTFLYQAAVGVNPRNYCGIQVVLDARGLSAAETTQDGIDMALNYSAQSRVGTFTVGVSATHILSNTSVLVAGAAPISNLDQVGQPISWRGRGNITYARGPFSTTLFANYTGKYHNNAPITIAGVLQPEADVSSWTTFDLSIAFAFPRAEARWAAMRGVRLGLSVTNLFDSDPPIVNSTVSGSSSIDLTAHNALGRFMQVQVTKAF